MRDEKKYCYKSLATIATVVVIIILFAYFVTAKTNLAQNIQQEETYTDSFGPYTDPSTDNNAYDTHRRDRTINPVNQFQLQPTQPLLQPPLVQCLNNNVDTNGDGRFDKKDCENRGCAIYPAGQQTEWVFDRCAFDSETNKCLCKKGCEDIVNDGLGGNENGNYDQNDCDLGICNTLPINPRDNKCVFIYLTQNQGAPSCRCKVPCSNPAIDPDDYEPTHLLDRMWYCSELGWCPQGLECKWYDVPNSVNDTCACSIIPGCGNAQVDPGEVCEPPDKPSPQCTQPGEICAADCKSCVKACGNNKIDPNILPPEQCDPPGTVGPPQCPQFHTCNLNCQCTRNCGNGMIDPGEQCEPRGNPNLGCTQEKPKCERNCTKCAIRRNAICGDPLGNPPSSCPTNPACELGTSCSTDGVASQLRCRCK